MINDASAKEVLQLNQRLLESIAAGDWATYESLCAPDMTCFEPEAAGHLVEGMAFHKFYFDLGAASGPRKVTMATPHVRLLGDATAILAYSRLVQRLDANGSPITSRVEETRVWQRTAAGWRLVHVHRSAPG
jgi:calcium/calmodulin-dependent protein kinase (CaM kinase) II